MPSLDEKLEYKTVFFKISSHVKKEQILLANQP